MSLHLFARLEQLDYLIRTRSTGPPAKLARRLGISERALYEFLAEMRSLDAPINYCKQCKTYYYMEKGRFFVRFKKKIESETGA